MTTCFVGKFNVIFFFKQKTAYEMRISDWSSDVCSSDLDGIFAFRSILPAGYPIPTTGVVGQLLHAQGRHPFRPAHVHALIFKDGYKTISAQERKSVV